MTESELLATLRIAKTFLAISTSSDSRAELRGVIGECSSRIHRLRQHHAAKRRNQK